MVKNFDFLVIGSGLAGMSFALKVAQRGTVCLITKTRLEETNTSLAQGGIAAVLSNDQDKRNHKQDTMICGSGLCDQAAVEVVVEEAREQIQSLISWGTQFDKTPDGSFDLAKEGGHSAPRILHYKDNTGWEIQRALTSQIRENKNITILEHHFAIEILTQHHLGEYVTRFRPEITCYGAYVLDQSSNEVHTIVAKMTYMATGGIGYIYQTTTNPPIATGDGIAMVYRAKGWIENMEFVQFHPTSLYNPSEKPAFLITEAMRGYGAVLRNIKGKEFMHKYDNRGSLAPRDIVARAIDKEMKIYGSDYVYLDCTHLNQKGLQDHFPNIYQKCLSLGIDVSKDYIPVAPAAHYVCGGIKVDLYGRTSIQNLFAGGECACTGLHGANRLASNSLLEACVFANRSATDALSKIDDIQPHPNLPAWNDEGTSYPEEMVLITQNWREMQQIMSYYVSIVRSDLRLKRALSRLEILFNETETLFKKTTVSRELCELRNAINVAYIIIKNAEARKRSIGLHFNSDYVN